MQHKDKIISFKAYIYARRTRALSKYKARKFMFHEHKAPNKAYKIKEILILYIKWCDIICPLNSRYLTNMFHFQFRILPKILNNAQRRYTYINTHTIRSNRPNNCPEEQKKHSLEQVRAWREPPWPLNPLYWPYPLVFHFHFYFNCYIDLSFLKL